MAGDTLHAEQASAPKVEATAEDEDDDALECRVCRGEADPDRPLYAPCMCAGSIMYTHQVSWKGSKDQTNSYQVLVVRAVKPAYSTGAPALHSTPH